MASIVISVAVSGKRVSRINLYLLYLKPEGSSKEHIKNWSRLNQKIYEADPVTCPKCQGRIRILPFIEDPEIIKKILKHLGLWDITALPPPKRANAPPPNIHIDSSNSQIPPSEDYLYCNPNYPLEMSAS
jgi:hypothetical protein